MAKIPQDAAAEHRRLAILSCLYADADYRINAVLLHSLLKTLDHGVPMSVFLADIVWLEQLRLVITETLPGCTMVLLRAEGAEVAEGLSVIPGIARPNKLV